MLIMKKVIIIIVPNFFSVNQFLIAIRPNPVVRIKQNAISDTVFNVQSPWHHFLQVLFQQFSFSKGFDESALTIKETFYRNFVPPQKKLKKVLLHTCAILFITTTIAFVIVPSVPKLLDRLTNMLLKKNFICKEINQTFVITVKLMIYFSLPVVILVKVLVSFTL